MCICPRGRLAVLIMERLIIFCLEKLCVFFFLQLRNLLVERLGG